MQVAIHAIGDGILDDILAAYEKALARHPGKDHRHGIVHCQITRPDQLDTFAKLSLHAYFQSIFLDYDIHIVEERIGKERAASSYHFRTLYETTHASNGSDCPVEPFNVLDNLRAAVTRQNRAGTRVYLPEQALTVEQAVRLFTSDAAWASRDEAVRGTLELGKQADLVVLDRDLFKISHQDFNWVKVLETVLNGVTVYRAETL